MRFRLLAVLCLVWSACAGCGEDGEQEAGLVPIDFPNTVTLSAERGLVALTGEVLATPNFKLSDLVTYRSSGVQISSGCPVHNADCQPLHVCRPTIQSLPTKYNSLDEVCTDVPMDGESSMIQEAEEHMGFTVRLNTSEGVARFWVQSVEGQGSSARLTLVYTIDE